MSCILAKDGNKRSKMMKTYRCNTGVTVLGFIVAVLLYSVLHANLSRIDAQHCHEYGLVYGGTSLMLDGYCVQGRTRVPAFMVGGE